MQNRFREEPGNGSNREENRLQVIRDVINEFKLLPPGNLGGGEDLHKVLAHVVGMTLRPAHALLYQATEGRDTLGWGLNERGVEHLIPVQVKLEGELPVFRDAGAPPDFAQDIGPDHVNAAGDHLHATQQLLSGAFNHIGAAVFRPNTLSDPVFIGIEHVPLITLHNPDALVNEFYAVPVAISISVTVAVPIPIAVPIAVLLLIAIEVVQELPNNLRRRHEVGIKNGDEFRSGVYDLQAVVKCGALEAAAVDAVGDLDLGVLCPFLQAVYGRVAGVIGDQNFIVVVVEMGGGLEKAVDNRRFVEHWELNGDEGLLLEPLLCSVSIPVSISVVAVAVAQPILSVAVLFPVVTVAIPQAIEALSNPAPVPIPVPITISVTVAAIPSTGSHDHRH